MADEFMEQCLARAIVSAQEAGKAILEVYRGEIEVEYKEDDSPLTLADKRAHTIIMNHLLREPLSHIPVLSEEGKHLPYETRKTWEDFWLVDPLDGTKEFVKGLGEFTVNIALIRRDRPVLGVVYVPVKSLLYFAAAGVGSYRLLWDEHEEKLFDGDAGPQEASSRLAAFLAKAEELPLHHDPESPGENIVLVGSRSHGGAALADFVRQTEERYGAVDFTPAGSALKFCLVAEGTAHAYPRLGPTMEWDTGAGQCVVEQSGGRVVRIRERTPLAYNKEDLRNPEFICVGKDCKDFEF